VQPACLPAEVSVWCTQLPGSFHGRLGAPTV